MLSMFALTAFTKFKLLKLDWYDAIALKRTDAFKQLWPHWVDIQSNRDLLHYCLSDYWFVPLGILLSTAFYYRKKHWLQAAFVLGYPLAFVLLVNVPYHESTHQFYMENLWLPLGLFAGLKPEHPAARAVMAGSILGFSLPTFWVGLMMMRSPPVSASPFMRR